MSIIVGKVGRSVDGYLSVKVDRSSPLGNPFFMKDESMRDQVCEQYKNHFDKQILIKGSKVHTEVVRIWKMSKTDKILLQCHCFPKRCHADHIKVFLDGHL